MNKNLEEIKNNIADIIRRKVTAEEMEYIKIWILNYNYDLDIISIVLCNCNSKTKPNFNTLHKIISHWHSKGLKTADDIDNYLNYLIIKNNKAVCWKEWEKCYINMV